VGLPIELSNDDVYEVHALCERTDLLNQSLTTYVISWALVKVDDSETTVVKTGAMLVR
jgi:hypothetical protein